eukprot:2646242-Prymnesium_polylepis.2
MPIRASKHSRQSASKHSRHHAIKAIRHPPPLDACRVQRRAAAQAASVDRGALSHQEGGARRPCGHAQKEPTGQREGWRERRARRRKLLLGGAGGGAPRRPSLIWQEAVPNMAGGRP